jgi:hypothetical protein
MGHLRNGPTRFARVFGGKVPKGAWIPAVSQDVEFWNVCSCSADEAPCTKTILAIFIPFSFLCLLVALQSSS